MHNNRLGCFTSAGVIAALITLFVIVGFAFTSGNQIFSAGALNAQTGNVYGGVNSHAQISECSACHAAPFGAASMADRCADCHTDIAAQMFDVAKLHGAINQNNPTLSCRECHPEHRGATASLTDMRENTFPHEALGYSLEGHQLTAKNEAFTCKDCHQEDVTTFASDACDSCHRQIDIAFAQAHTLSFGTDCLGCHDGVDKFGDDFTHASFAFQLEGKHMDVPCTKCHLDARTIVDLQSVPQDCFSCHRDDDEHAGKFGTDCETCHTSNSWEDAIFDHTRSGFPLTGAHVNIVCEDCHKNEQFAGLEITCVACHAEPVEHAGQFGTDCTACHSTDAWTPATFNGEHTFPLDHGESGVVSCATCHPSTYTTYTCYGCHEHSESNIISEHREEGISNFENCIECHADGREHDD